MKRLAIIITHPIQYYAPVFAMLQQREKINIKVFYTWGEIASGKYDPGFNKNIAWDVPLLEGYAYEWVKNASKRPGSHHFNGIINPDLISRILLFEPNAILVFGWAWQSHLKAIRYFKGKLPVYFRGDSTLLDKKHWFKSLFRLLFLRWVYQHINHAFYVGANNKEYYLKYGLKENQLSFAPHAVDNDRFAVDRKNEAALLRQDLAIKSDALIILFAGKLEAKKDPTLLFDAFSTIKLTGVHLLFVGNGPLEKQLKVKANGTPNVHFLDFQNQSRMPVVYQACDIFCLPSGGPNETWGLVVNEAMACGKVILVSDKVGSAADLVSTDHNGYVFKAGDLAGLSVKLSELLNKGKNKLSVMGQNSYKIIKNWSFESQVIAIESTLNNEGK